MKRSLAADSTPEIIGRLQKANEDFAMKYPGETGRRQPVHTVYGGAHLFKADSAQRLGSLAQRSLEQFAPDFVLFAKAVGLPGADGLDEARAGEYLSRIESSGESIKEEKAVWLAHAIYTRVWEKLRREPVEDFRIDFEDGYGNRPDAEEDGHAELAAKEVAKGLSANSLPPFIGIRIKPFTEELKERSIRTLDIFVSTLYEEAGKLPENFFITLPKVTIPEQVAALSDLFDALEQSAGIESGTLKMEMMIETTQSIINHRGEANIPLLLEAARGRCVAAHFGTYDYTASCNITAAHQHMMHPACDFARNMMQVALGGTGIWLSDGATNIMPVAPHRVAEGAKLSTEQIEENLTTVHRAWRLHYEHIQHSLTNAFYQGWDLHPAQLPTRYAAIYAFFLDSLEAASERLRNFVEKAAKATLVGDVFDDAATGQGLLNYFLRAINCGAITESEALELSSLTLPELRSGSFVKILKNRQSL
ncbi:MAG: phosphoenolpyruvate kinase [Acidobacteria bacterium 13_1_20CM_3_53_8]|nr:MAG: phosphoenolpyruvate kinase [Acidobacteria bacterium 13_1_20CM_3_53_8]